MSKLSSLNLSWRFIRVWQRNCVVYRRIWHINFIPPLLEPFFYLIAFGLGLSALIKEFSFDNYQISYIAFITPAILAINIMQNSFFENTYASFVRMYYQKTFDAMMATPLSLQEVITAEIIWGATKSLIGTVIMLAVVSVLGLLLYPEGLIQYPLGLLIIPLSFLGGIAFGAIGMFFTGTVPSIDMFNLPVFLFITPMFLFSGTFFPVSQLPQWAQTLALVFPLTHLVKLTRYFALGMLDLSLLWSVGYLVVFTILFYPLALLTMHRRLVK